MKTLSQVFTTVAAVMVLVASSALAQKPETRVVKGKIAAVEGSTVVELHVVGECSGQHARDLLPANLFIM